MSDPARATTPPPGRGTVRVWAVVAAGAVVVAALVRVVTVLYTGWGLYTIRAGAPGRQLSREELDAGDTVVVLGLVTFVVVLLAAVSFLVWLFLARTVTGRTSSDPPRWGRGWTIGAWFVPVANLVLPLLVVADLWRAATRRSPVPVVVWWVCGLLAIVFDQIAGAARLAGGATAADRLDALYAVAVLHTVESVLDLAAAALAVLLVRRITTRSTGDGPPAAPWTAPPGALPPPPPPGAGQQPAPVPGPVPPVAGPAQDEPARPPRRTGRTVGLVALAVAVVAALVVTLVFVGRDTEPLASIPIEDVTHVVSCGDRIIAYGDHGPNAAVINPRTDTVASVLTVPRVHRNLRCDAAGRRAFVPTGSTLRVLDLGTGRGVDVPTPVDTTDVATTPDGRSAWFTTDQATTTGTPPGLFSFDPDSGAPRLVTPLPAGRSWAMAATPDGAHVYLADTTSALPLRVVDTRTGAVTEITVPPQYTYPGYQPGPAEDIAMSPDGRTVHLAEIGSVAVIDTTTGTLVRRLDPGSVPARIAPTPDGRSLVVLSPVPGKVIVLDVGGGGPTGRIDVGTFPGPTMYASDVAVSPANGRTYVATPNGVAVADTP